MWNNTQQAQQLTALGCNPCTLTNEKTEFYPWDPSTANCNNTDPAVYLSAPGGPVGVNSVCEDVITIRAYMARYLDWNAYQSTSFPNLANGLPMWTTIPNKLVGPLKQPPASASILDFDNSLLQQQECKIVD